MISIRQLKLLLRKADLATLPEGKLLINTINAFSYNNARKDAVFEEALFKGDVLIPDGVSIVRACHMLDAVSKPWERIAGWDLFSFEMNKLNLSVSETWDDADFYNWPYWKKRKPDRENPIVMFLGSSDDVLQKIHKRAAEVYPNLEVETYSPPYKRDFSLDDTLKMCDAVNVVDPDLLWIGMTAPKQEKWTYTNWDRLDIYCHVGTVGAVFDFFAGTKQRAPFFWQIAGFEWLYRLLKEPRRMWRRYIIGNSEFIYLVLVERLNMIRSKNK